jgi:ABC-type Fe3+/spermidine/putrescine transport system ATPase subunit
MANEESARLKTRSATHVRIDNIVHSYGEVDALKHVSLETVPGEFLTLLGPSGSGKTTLLRIIAGLVKPSQGRVSIGAIDVTDSPPERRDIGFVFQNYALFPHMSVRDNIAFPLKMRRVARQQIDPHVSAAVSLVGLRGLESRLPSQLSGGQQQRVALARAIVFRPRVLLLDEPLGALDKQLRQQLGFELRKLQRELGITTVYVTHDQEEAFTLSNRIAVMHQGAIVQLGAPDQVYRHPVNSFVAHFVGELNDFEGTVIASNGMCVTLRTGDGLEIRSGTGGHWPTGSPALFSIRPEHLQVVRERGQAFDLPATVQTAIFGGSWTRAEVKVSATRTVVAETRGREPLGYKEGERVWVRYETQDVLVLQSEE